MNISDILKWQWSGYGKYHQSRMNLWIHIFAVPIFIVATFSLVISLVNFSVLSFLFSMVLMALSIGIQGFGHSKEELPAEPFTGPKNTLMRIFLEQFYTFPKFVLSGRWYLALRDK